VQEEGSLFEIFLVKIFSVNGTTDRIYLRVGNSILDTFGTPPYHLKLTQNQTAFSRAEKPETQRSTSPFAKKTKMDHRTVVYA